MSYDDVLGDDIVSENMKKFGLEFVLQNKSNQAFSQIMDQQKRLEKQLNNTIKAFNKFQSSTNNNSFDSAVKKMDKLTESVKRYNNAVKNVIRTLSEQISARVIAETYKYEHKDK